MKYQRVTKIFAKKMNGKWYILEPNKKIIRELNEVGSFIWQQLVKPRDINEVVNAICKEYRVDAKTAETDVRKFISEYVKDGYISEIS